MSKEQPIDVRDMAIIHRTFRAGYAEAAQLVRTAPTPSPERVRFLADHIDFAIAALHIEALAAALERLNAVAQRHLDDEEQNIVPLAAVTLTQQEWNALGQHGLAQMPRNKRRLAFGMILDPLDEADRTYMKGFLPAPVRMLYPLLIERPWKKYASTLRTGT